MYTNAPLPRPPRPLPFQSSRYLEDTLLRSERLARSWTTEPMQEISSVEIPIDQGESLGYPKVLCGKWCIYCESSTKFVLRNVDSNTCTPQVLWEDVPSITCWDAHSVISADGQLVLCCVSNQDRFRGRARVLVCSFMFDFQNEFIA